MSMLNTGMNFVLCRNCLRAFDVDTSWSSMGNTRAISQESTCDGEYIVFEAECPHCFELDVFNTKRDLSCNLGNGKEIEVYKLANAGLRRRLAAQNRRVAHFEEETAKLRMECKKLADTIHIMKSANKPTRQRKAKGGVSHDVLPGIR